MKPTTRRVTAPSLRAMKAQGKPIVAVTAYDATFGSLADEAGVDIVLVGDSLANVVFGRQTTLEVTLEDVEHHVRATRSGVKSAMLVADLPFGSYGGGVSQAVDSAVRLVRAGAEAVKIEGAFPSEIAAIQKIGVPVMGHVGMTPQSVHRFGGFKIQGKGDSAAESVCAAAAEVDEAGVFALVLELVPSPVAQKITGAVSCPTIGIGAGPACDGQIQVLHDVIGLSETVFHHAKPYAQARECVLGALSQYAQEVRARSFPTEEQSF